MAFKHRSVRTANRKADSSSPIQCGAQIVPAGNGLNAIPLVACFIADATFPVSCIVPTSVSCRRDLHTHDVLLIAEPAVLLTIFTKDGFHHGTTTSLVRQRKGMDALILRQCSEADLLDGAPHPHLPSLDAQVRMLQKYQQETFFIAQ